MSVDTEASDRSCYIVRQDQRHQIVIDGRIGSEEWQIANEISEEFAFPWDDVGPPTTRFRAAWRDNDLLFSFDVEDADVIAAQNGGDERSVDRADRVELFFAPAKPGFVGQADMPLSRYVAIEIAPNGIVHDYSVRFYRDFDSTWAVAGAQIETSINGLGYQVEGRIPMTALPLPQLKREELLRVGVFRAEFSLGEAAPVEQWISWVKPRTPTPDFHVPSAFGCWKLY